MAGAPALGAPLSTRVSPPPAGAQGKDPILIEGQGRWRMHAQEPGEMWIKYRQAFVYEKKTVSDL